MSLLYYSALELQYVVTISCQILEKHMQQLSALISVLFPYHLREVTITSRWVGGTGDTDKDLS